MLFSLSLFPPSQTLVQVPASLIKRCKSHFYDTGKGVSFVFGVNGWVWIYPSAMDVTTMPDSFSSASPSPLAAPAVRVTPEVRKRIARVRNCFQLLANNGVEISPQTVMAAFDLSVTGKVEPADLLTGEASAVIAEEVRKTIVSA